MRKRKGTGRGPGVLASSEEGDRILGFYAPGGTPTILEHDDLSWLTAIHEQTHRDDINNTLYGFVVRCEAELADANGCTRIRRWLAGRSLAQLLSHAWNALEGSAVAAEHLALLRRGDMVLLKEVFGALPREYRRAASPYLFMLHEGIIKQTEQILSSVEAYIWISAHRTAMAELALDLDLLPLVSRRVTYRGLCLAALRSRPGRNVKKVCEAFFGMDHRAIPTRIDMIASKGSRATFAGGELSISFRQYVIALKECVSQQLSLSLEEGACWDVSVQALAAQLRSDLETRYSTLRRWHWANEYVGMSSWTDLAAGAPIIGEMQEVEVGAEGLAALLVDGAKPAGHLGRLLHVTPMETSNSVHVAVLHFLEPSGPEHVCRFLNVLHCAHLPSSQLVKIETTQQLDDFAWCAFARLSSDGVLPQADLWFSLAKPVFLYQPVFDSDVIEKLVVQHGAVVELRASPAPGPLSYVVLTARIRGVTILWIDSSFEVSRIRSEGGLFLTPSLQFAFAEEIDVPMFRAMYVAALNVLSGFVPRASDSPFASSSANT
jgi:hypothetical protein